MWSTTLRGAIRRMRNRVSRENPPERVLHRDEAESRARQATAASFDVGDEALEVVSEEHRPSDGTWAFVLVGPSARYEVVVADELGSASVASVRRTNPLAP